MVATSLSRPLDAAGARRDRPVSLDPRGALARPDRAVGLSCLRENGFGANAAAYRAAEAAARGRGAQEPLRPGPLRV